MILIKRFLDLKIPSKRAHTRYLANFQNTLKTEAVFKEKSIELNVHTSSGLVTKQFPYIWLRDNCKCSKCYNYTADEIEIDITKVLDSTRPIDVKETSKSLQITWDDGHESEFDIKKLTSYAFEDKKAGDEKVLWNKKIISETGLRKFDYKNYLTDDSVLRSSLESIKKYGAVIIEGVPSTEKEVVNVCKRIGPIQNSHFGAECIVTNSLSFVDRAYTNLSLKAHTDNAYLKNTAGIEMFHVIKRPEQGGESLLVDGFYCAEKLRKEFREDFDTLTRLKVESQFFKEGSFDLKYVDSVIKLNQVSGNLRQIRFNPYHKINLTHLSYEDIQKYYKAIRNFSKIIQDPSNENWIALKEDQVLMFDNFRLMHGRSAFKGNRALVTAYLSRDDWLSKASVLNV